MGGGYVEKILFFLIQQKKHSLNEKILEEF